MAFVLDASATLPWCFQDETTPASEALLARMGGGEEALVPAHWPTEVLNSLLRGKRRGRVSGSNLQRFLDDLGSFRITVGPSLGVDDLTGLKELSERLELSAYDAAYLDLASRTGKSMPERLAAATELTKRLNRMRGIDLDERKADFTPSRVRRRQG
ncbi:MAG: type II toxin-antitoxin system VapC family toxin [Acidobacteriaceae bacterium]